MRDLNIYKNTRRRYMPVVLLLNAMNLNWNVNVNQIFCTIFIINFEINKIRSEKELTN